jgi:monovalent cation/hydrogen antiporter
VTFFESLLALLLAAIVLLQASRRFGLPYPAMLAVAGVVIAFVPGAPTFRIEPATALALFIAPVLLDAAYDFPLNAARRLWRPLMVLALGAVLVTAAAVAWIGWAVAGLPIAAALVLGAIVAPPDAAAATAVMSAVSLPRRTVGVLKGESLFNDATALLLFSGALAVQSVGGLNGSTALQLGLAAPGGVVLGIALGFIMRRVSRFVAGTLGGNILQFVSAFGVWLLAEHLHLSAVLAVVSCAMTLAAGPGATGGARMRVHSFAVWSSVVFLLNVLAFMLMGMQARVILLRMPPERLWEAGQVAGLVILACIAVRFAVVMLWNRAARASPAIRGELPPPTPAQGVIVAWSGMRGLLSLATAFALPAGFPQRDLVVLTAFAVVLATLVVQGLTLGPLIRLLRLHQMENPENDMAEARRALSTAADLRLRGEEGAAAESLRALYRLKRDAAEDDGARAELERHRALGLAVVAEQRRALDRLLDEERIGMDEFYRLQEEIDWRELTLLPDGERRIEEV